MDKAIAYLTNEYSPSKFSKPKVENGSRRVPANGPDLSEESEESEDENEKTNLQSEEDQESEDEKPVVKNKRKVSDLKILPFSALEAVLVLKSRKRTDFPT